MRKIAVLYYSMSGNTKELAERVASIMTDSLPSDVSVELIRLSAVKREETPMIDGAYDAYLIGTFTWGKGEVHDQAQRFFVKNISVLRSTPVYYFGTGDTQFGGDELFCNALDVLNSKVPTDYDLLKVEQSVRGSQEQLVYDWCTNLARILKRRWRNE